MKNSKIILIILISLIAFVFYQIGKNHSPPVIIESIEEKEKELTCPYKMKATINQEYLEYGWPIEITDKPKFVVNPEVIRINKPFVQKEFEKLVYKLPPTDDGWSYEEFDVDGDGKKEKIISANVAMNHTPHLALIVKNGNIIFESEEANNVITEERLGDGFLRTETVDWITGETLKTKYVYKDGGFIPVWTQKGCLIQFE